MKIKNISAFYVSSSLYKKAKIHENISAFYVSYSLYKIAQIHVALCHKR